MSKYCKIKQLVDDSKAGRWWDESDNKETEGSDRWETLQHNGILFPPPYEPVVGGVRVLYKGQSIKLDSVKTDNKFNLTEEEGAMLFAMVLEQDNRLMENQADRKSVRDDKKFIDNFWDDWKVILGSNNKIKDISKVDFSPFEKYIQERSEQKKVARKEMSKEEKEMEKEQKESVKDIYGYALVDGVKIPIASYSPQPPSLFKGHGTQPLRGKIKSRAKPSDMTLNVSRKFVPECYINGNSCKWGKIVELKDVTWMASYTHPITKGKIYFWLKRDQSHWACMDDMLKFDKARKLNKNISSIRKKYKKDLSSTNSNTRQLATAVYFLDEIAIRPGSEKDTAKEADTVGLTTLKCGHVTFKGNNKIVLDFTGKSSIKFSRTIIVNPKVYKNMKDVCGSSKTKALFPSVKETTLNAYLGTLLKGITSKNFRTWKASSILQKELSANIPSMYTPLHEKKDIYERINIKVATELNHKRMTNKAGKAQKLEDEIKDFEEKEENAKTDKQKEKIRKSIIIRETKLEQERSNTATSTSKVNYLDPRIFVAWAKSAEMPIESIYTTDAQRQKFKWAMETPSKWVF
jgi:DNA topoisomerase-1